MKLSLIVSLLLLFSIPTYSQGFNDGKTSLANFIKRMYNTAPFEGVKIIEDYDHNYFIFIVLLDKAKYTSSSTMNRVAQIKARQQANTFFNGSTISSDLVIKTTQTKDSTSSKLTVEMIESIRENSVGFVQGMELLINFDTEEGKRMVFVYYREMKEEGK
jgi:deoxyadenosine/deoxycytidine kinase